MKLLALVEEPGHVCCRYRIRAFEPALEEAGCSLTCEGLDRGAFFRSIQLHRAGKFDAVVLQRKLLPSWQLKRSAGLAPAGVRLRRRGDVPRLLFSSPRAQPLENKPVRPTCRQPTRSSPGTTSLRTRCFEPGPVPSECT